MPSRYTFCDYSPEWPREFERETERLRILLGDELVAVHHIGSTSVPGLPAKPIIDLMPLVWDIEHLDLDAFTLKFVKAGYKAWGEYGISGRRYFTKDHGEWRTHNVHIFQHNDPQIERHLAFCAYLREHPGVSAEYAALKREVYARHPADISAYNEGKDVWIKRVERLALEWYHHLKSAEADAEKQRGR